MLFNNHRRRIHAGRPLRTTLEALEDRTTPTLPTVTTVTALPSPVAVGGTAELTATVAELNPNFSYEPFGDVVFRVGDVVVGSAALIPSETMPFVSVASISFATGTLTAGGYTVTATYPGEPGFEIDGHDPSAGTTRFELSAPAVSPPAVLPVVPSVPPPLVPTGTAVRLTAAGSDAGGPGMVQVFNGDGSRRIDIAPYGAEFTGGVRVAVADVTGDAVPDIVCAPGPGIPVVVKAYSGTDGRLVWEQPSFGDAFRSGAFVSAGDINRDGAAEVAVSPDQGGGPRVDVYAGGKFEKIVSFFGIDDPNFRGGARTTIGDFDGDGRGELAVAAGLGGGPRMAVFTGATVAAGTPARLLSDFFVFEQTLRNGVYVAAGNVAGSPADELLVGGGPGGGPRVMAFDGDGLAAGDTSRVVANFFAGDPNVRGGVRLAVGDLNGDGQGEILTGIGPGAASVVRAFRPDGGAVQDVSAFGGAFLGGVFVGGTGGSVRVSGITGGSVPGQFVDLFGQFLPGVPTRVVFADGGGYRVEVPAAEVTNNRVRVGLPVYTDPTGDISDVAFTAAVAQVTPGGEIFSPTFTRSVGDIDAVGENPGDLTEGVFEDVRESLLASIFDLEYAAQFLGDGFAGEKLLDEAYAELATLDGQLGEFEELPDPGEVYVPPPAVGLDPSGFPEYPPFSVPDVSLADYGFGQITTGVGNVDDAAAQILRVYNEAGARAFEQAGRAIGGQAAVVGMGVATAIRVGTNNVIQNNLPPVQADRLWPQGVLPQGLQSNATAPRQQANPLYGTWEGSKTFGPTKRSFVLTISQNGVSLRISGNRAAEFSTGSGRAPASVIGSTSVSGQAVGSWSSSLGSTRSVGFSGGLTSDGRLDCNIDGIEVFLSK